MYSLEDREASFPDNNQKKMSLRKKIVLLVLIAVVFILFMLLFGEKLHMRDFEVNYTAGKRLRMSEPLYRAEDGHYMFKYFPSSALLYLPLSFFPLGVAKGIWFSVVALSLFLLVSTSGKILGSKQKKPVYLLVLPPLILARFFLRELQLGQVNAVVGMVLLLMVWVLVAEETGPPARRELPAGLLWGVASALKPHALIFLPYFLIKKKRLSLASGLGFLGLFLLAPSVFYGFQGNLRLLGDWVSTLSRSTPRLLTSQDNVSLLAFFMKWTGDRQLSLALFGLGISLLAVSVFRMIVKGQQVERPEVLECASLLICIPLVSPLGWDYTFVISVLGIMLLLDHFSVFTKLWRGVLIANLSVIAFSLYNLLGRELYAAFMSSSVITVNFLVLVGYLGCLRFRKVC